MLSGLQKIRRDLETRLLKADDGYTRRMFPFTTVATGRVEALKDMVQAAARAFNEVKQYYGEGDDKYDAVTNPIALSRPTSLEFFGIFKTFLTSYDVSPTWCIVRLAGIDLVVHNHSSVGHKTELARRQEPRSSGEETQNERGWLP